MALVDSVDYENRRIYLSAETMTVEVHPVEIYKEVRELRRLNEAHRGFSPLISAKGNEIESGQGTSQVVRTQRYAVLNFADVTIVPFDATHVLNIIGKVIRVDGQSGLTVFDRAPLASTSRVDINYNPPQVEVREVSTGGTTQEVTTLLNQILSIVNTILDGINWLRARLSGNERIRDNRYQVLDKDTGDVIVDKNVTRNGTEVDLTEVT